MRRKTLAAFCGLAATASIGLSACSSSGASSSSSGTVTLSVVGWKGGSAEPANMAKINSAFEASHPNIKINYTFVDSSEYQTKLNAELLGGGAQDVIMANTSEVPRWAESGYLQDLSAQPWVADLSSHDKPLSEVGSKVYAEPNELTGIGLFSNLKVLKAAGLSAPPATWPELISDLQALKKAGQPGLALPDQSGWTVFEAINSTAADSVYAQDPIWDSQLAAGTASFTSTPGWKNALTQVEDLGSQGLINYSAQLGVNEWGQGLQNFEAGKDAFLLQGSWAMDELSTAVGASSLALSPWPGGQSGSLPVATTAVGTMWTINAHTSHLRAAQEYLAYWSTAAALTPYLTAEASVSPFSTVPSPTVAGASSFLSAVNARRFWVLPENGWAGGQSQTGLGNADQALILGKSTVDQTLLSYDTIVKKDAS